MEQLRPLQQQVVDAYVELHRCGVIHEKPLLENWLISPDSKVKLIDFKTSLRPINFLEPKYFTAGCCDDMMLASLRLPNIQVDVKKRPEGVGEKYTVRHVAHKGKVGKK